MAITFAVILVLFLWSGRNWKLSSAIMDHQQKSVTNAMIEPPRRSKVPAVAFWAGALGLLWAALNPGDPKSWLVGVPVVVLAAGVATALGSQTPPRMDPLAALRFAAFFVHQSFRGAWDVAKRAFHPRLPLNPGLVTYSLRLPEGPAQVFLTNITSLLPGTVSANLDGRNLLLHVLDAGPAVPEEMRVLENHVAALFALDLTGERKPAHD